MMVAKRQPKRCPLSGRPLKNVIIREAELCSRLIYVDGVYADSGNIWIVMEFVPGVALGAHLDSLKKVQATQKNMYILMANVVRAVEEVTAAGIVEEKYLNNLWLIIT